MQVSKKHGEVASLYSVLGKKERLGIAIHRKFGGIASFPLPRSIDVAHVEEAITRVMVRDIMCLRTSRHWTCSIVPNE
jgi:hypothetical protein